MKNVQQFKREPDGVKCNKTIYEREIDRHEPTTTTEIQALNQDRHTKNVAKLKESSTLSLSRDSGVTLQQKDKR